MVTGLLAQRISRSPSRQPFDGTVAEYLGSVRGLIVRAPTFAQGITGGLKSFIGGNIESCAESCEIARTVA